MSPVTESNELRTHYVYRLYSSDEELLYVGVTGNVASRFIGHHHKPWWPEVNQWKITRAPNRITGLYLEAEAILTEHPRHNIDIPTWSTYKAFRSRALPEFQTTHEDRMMLLEAENARLRQQIRSLLSQPQTEVQTPPPHPPAEEGGPFAGSGANLSAVLSGLSRKDVDFLRAMAEDDGPSLTLDIRRRIGGSSSLISNYRLRLMAAGLIHKSGFGQLDLSVPGLREHLREPSAASA